MVENSISQKRTLFLITSSFPFGEFETFLETEFPYLEDSFDKIFIVYTELVNSTSRIFQKRAHVHYLPYLPSHRDKLKYYKLIFNSYVLKELKNLLFKDIRLPSPGILSSMAGSLTVGLKLKQTLVELITTNKLWETKIFIYSYWCNDMATGLALLKSNYPQLHCVCRAHGYDVYLERSFYKYLPFRRLIFSKLDCVCFVSEHGKNYSESKFGSYKSFSVSYLGVNEGSRIKNGVQDNLQLVSCSSVIPIKRLHLIVEALASIKDISIHWTHIGGGGLLSSLKKYAHNLLSPKPNLTFEFLGQISNNETLQFFSDHKVDLFINVSEHEGLPVSMMEAIAHGIPVIGPDVGGIRELIQDESNGYLIHSDVTKEKIIAAIEKFIKKDNDSLMAMSRNARSTWRNRFQAATNYKKFIKQITNG